MQTRILLFIFLCFSLFAARIEFQNRKAVRGVCMVKDGKISVQSVDGLYQYAFSTVRSISAHEKEAIIVGDFVELRKEPSHTSDTVLRLYEGTTVRLHSHKNEGFRRVRAFDKEGWVREEHLKRNYLREEKLRPVVRMNTARGEVQFELFEDQTPNTVANFISLVEKGFYNKLNFHRVDPGFIVMGGDPEGTGEGGPGYKIKSEILTDLRNLKGYVGMADSGVDTAGSQFYILLADAPHLDGRYTVFGKVISGFENVTKIQVGDSIYEASVVAKRDHSYSFVKISTENP